MGRQAAPRWYESRKGWYAWIGGRQVLLAKGKGAKKEATERFHKLMVEGTAPASRADLSVNALAELFVAAIVGSVEPITHAGYVRRIQSFISLYGNAKATDIRPYHVAAWLDKHPTWNDSTRSGYVTAIKRLYSWAVKMGYLDANPIKGVEKPPMGNKEIILTPEQAERVLAEAWYPALRDVLLAIAESGCRPNEVFTLKADGVDVEAGTWTVVNKTRRKTKEPTRKVILTARLIEVSRRLAAEHPEGTIFRNSRGRPWTVNALACAFDEIRKRLGYGHEVTPYSLRHRFVTDALVAGVPVATVATLVGHRGTAMVMRHYSHLDKEHAHLKEAIGKIRPDASAGEDSPAGGNTSPGRASPSVVPPPPDEPKP